MLKAVLSGYYGFKNFGDEAILSVLVSHLKSLGVDVTVFSSDPTYTAETYSVRSVKNFDLFGVINTIKNSDLLISGGGSLLQDVTSLKSLVYYTFIIAAALLFNKKVIIFAQGIGPINCKFAQFIVMNLLKFCNLVTVRDEKSLNLLTDFGVKAKLVCDPVYSLSVSNSIRTSKVGIQLRNFKTMNNLLLQKLALFIVEKYSDRDIEIFSLQTTQDYELSKTFRNMLLSINKNISVEIVSDDIIDKITQLDILIGMRFHALLVAIKAGVNCCAINYDIKVEKLAEDAAIPVISMDANEDFDDVYLKLQNLKREDLLRFAGTKSFDWSEFDSLLTVSE